MLRIYGSKLCGDCVQCMQDLDRIGVAYEFLDFGDSLEHLKYFLSVRDREAVFEDVRKAGKIGIPCILDDNGKISLDWSFFCK